jgi:polysaccharide export outer membrane protein
MTNRPSMTGWFAATVLLIAALATVPAEVADGQPPTTRRVMDAAQRAPVVPRAPCANGLPCAGDACACQPLSPASPYPIWGVDSATAPGGYPGCGEVGWDARGLIPWQQFAQGEYVGLARTPHVPEYRLREDDLVGVYFRRARNELSRPYELQVGDRIRVESLTAGRGTPAIGANQTEMPEDVINRELVIQPDGTITLPLLGQVKAARMTVPQLRDELEKLYSKYYRTPAITVTPIQVNTRLEDLLNTVDSRAGVLGGLQVQTLVTPSGHIQLPAVGSVFVQGLTLDEARQEIDARYDAVVPDIQVTLDLVQRARRYVYVVGEVGQPGRYELEAPTTAMQAIALAGGWNVGANLRQVVVFRRGPDWRLMATMVDLRGALYGRRPVPADDIWLNDSDIVLVPKTPVQVADELIEQLLTRGLYRVVPSDVVWNISGTTSL